MQPIQHSHGWLKWLMYALIMGIVITGSFVLYQVINRVNQIEHLEEFLKELPLPSNSIVMGKSRYGGCSSLDMYHGSLSFATDLSQVELTAFYKDYIQTSEWTFAEATTNASSAPGHHRIIAYVGDRWQPEKSLTISTEPMELYLETQNYYPFEKIDLPASVLSHKTVIVLSISVTKNWGKIEEYRKSLTGDAIEVAVAGWSGCPGSWEVFKDWLP